VTPPKQQQQQLRKSSADGNCYGKKKREEHPEMKVKKRETNEILLIGSVLGSGDDAAPDDFVPVTDSKEWLQDLQRVINRDHDVYRPISLYLAKLKFAPSKLIPIAVSCEHDRALVLTTVKLLVCMTKPMSEEAKKAGRLVVDVKSGKVEDDVIQEQINLRKNALEQSDMLMEYKRLFVRHASHRYAFQPHGAKGRKKGGTGLFSVFTTLLAEPLSKTGSSRGSQDHLAVELVLHLVRNLLCIAPLNTFGSPAKSQAAAQLHRDLLIILKEENVLDVLVVLGQEIDRRENKGYNMLLMDILGHLLRGEDPSDVALSTVKSPTPSLSTSTTLLNTKRKSKTPTKTRTVTTTTRASSDFGDSLRAHLQTERQKTQSLQSSRHSHFGGTLLVNRPGGGRSYVSASDYLSRTSRDGGVSAAALARPPARRKNKKAEVFVGSGKATLLHSSASSKEVGGQGASRAKAALHEFCSKFAKDCYGPLMKSLKDEFRRETAKLEDGDRSIFFRIIWFFHQWWRVGRERGKEDGVIEKSNGPESTSDGSVQNLLFTMDVFMFNLVLNSTDECFEHKKLGALAQTVALYTEMIHTLHAMYESKDSTERMMALGLMDKLFYANEPVDRLPRLLSRWTPGAHSREYLCDLVECSHVTWKLLDANAQRCLKAMPSDESRPTDQLEKMNINALDFEKEHYFARKFVSNQIIFMYTQLLSQYATNAPRVNRHVAAYFIRVCKFSIKNVDMDDGAEFDDALGANYLVSKPSTLEPMLYNVGLLSVLDKVLNDSVLRDKEDLNALLMFASSFMKRFARAAEANPMLYVEALFKHQNPQQFCESTANMYVNEELRMIAVKDLLLEDQRKYEQQAGEDADEEEEDKIEEEGVGAGKNMAPGYEEDDEEELEFNGDDDDMATEGIVKKKRRRKPKKSRKSKSKSVTAEEDQPDDEDDEAELNRNDGGGDDDNMIEDQDHTSREEQNEGMSFEARGSDLRKQQGDDNPPSHTGAEVTAGAESESPKLSGKKRIRKSQRATQDYSDEEEFSSYAAGPTAKATRRVIFDDDDSD